MAKLTEPGANVERVSRRSLSVCQTSGLGFAAILLDDGEQDGDEGGESDEVEERPMLVCRRGEGHERPVEGEQRKGHGEPANNRSPVFRQKRRKNRAASAQPSATAPSKKTFSGATHRVSQTRPTRRSKRPATQWRAEEGRGRRSAPPRGPRRVSRCSARGTQSSRCSRRGAERGSVDDHVPAAARRRGWSARTAHRSSQPRFRSFRMTKASAKLRTGSSPDSLARCSRTAMRCSA